MPPNQLKTIKYFKESAERNYQTAIDLFKLKRYDSCLFFCHLALGKFIKALIVAKTNKPAPYIHTLPRLAELAGLSFSEEQTKNLKIISTFNISGRYDDEKLAFYKLCNKSYTDKYLKITKKLYLWLKENYPKR